MLLRVVDGRLEAGDCAKRPNARSLVCMEVGRGGGSRPARLVDKLSKNEFMRLVTARRGGGICLADGLEWAGFSVCGTADCTSHCQPELAILSNQTR